MPNSRSIAAAREYANRNHRSHAGILGDPTRIDEDGVSGELAFAIEFQIDTAEVNAKGPTGCNFTLADGTRVDVRTSRAAGFLMVPESKVQLSNADVWVLAKYSEATGKARLIGWATKADLLAAPCYVPTKLAGGIKSYNLDARSLREIDDLKKRHTRILQPNLF